MRSVSNSKNSKTTNYVKNREDISFYKPDKFFQKVVLIQPKAIE